MIETKHWLIEVTNQWKQLLSKHNWYTMTPIQVEFENDKMTAGYEFEVIILGLGIRVRYNTDKALQLFKEWSKEADEAIGEEKLYERARTLKKV